ncbi:MAG: SLBB domain-containing protein [Saprospiraceae bacterium]
MKKILLFLALFIGFQILAFGQAPQLTPEEIKAEIAKRGLNPSEVEAKMKEKGFDMYNLKPEEVPAAQVAFNQVANELEAQKGQPTGQPNTPPANADKPAGDGSSQTPAANSPDNQPAQSGADAAKDTLPPSPNEIRDSLKTETALQDSLDKAKPGEPLQPGELPADRIYGQQVFRDRQIQLYTQTTDINTPPDYVLGSGDKLVVSVWSGVANYSESLEIGLEGYAAPKTLPRVYLRGLSFEKARSQLRAVYSQRYPVGQGNFEVSLVSARTIDVSITGEVFNFGSFKISGLNTAFHALVASGGPTNIGTIRNIALYRSGQPKRTIDVYQYLLDPTVSRNFYLQNGDNIYVGPIGRVVRIRGGVNRGDGYELVAGENLRKLIQWAGGLKKDAYLDNIQISRIANQKREIIDLNLKELLDNNRDFELFDGDIITIKAIEADVENYVDVAGAVYYPDRYAVSGSSRLKELLEKAKLKKDARTDFAQLIRTDAAEGTSEYIRINPAAALAGDTAANILLQPRDRVVLFTVGKFTDKLEGVESNGALRTPTKLPFDIRRTLRVSDLLLLSGGTALDAAEFGYITRTFPDRPKEVQYLRVPLKSVEENPGPANPDDLLLEPGDRLFVPSKNSFLDSYTAKSDGALRNPREVPVGFGQPLLVGNLLELSNGLLPDAADFGYIFRTYPDRPREQSTLRVNLKEILTNPASPENIAIQPGDRLFVPNKSAFLEASYSAKSEGAVRNAKTFQVDFNRSLRVSNVIELSNGLQPDAVDFAYIFRTYIDRPKEQSTIRVNLRAALAAPGSADDLPLEPGDRLFIPNKSAYLEGYSVKSEGAFRNPQQYPIDFTKSLKISNLIELSGGLQVDATDFGYVFRTYPDRPKEQTYIRVDLRKIAANPGSAEDFQLEPNDRVLAMSKGLFKDEYDVRVTGLVRKPGSYRWDPSLRLEDVITLAGGLKMEAASNRVEVFRVIINQNRPTQQTVGQFEIDENFRVKNASNFVLLPYDIIAIRPVPNFEFQKMMFVEGEVPYPGEYALVGKNEKLSSVIKRAGGLGPEAFAAGATLFRQQDSTGFVVINLREALKKPNSYHNLILKEGDKIFIPKVKDIVSVTGATKAAELYPKKVFGNGGKLNFPWEPGKRAKHYIKKYAAGFGEEADRNTVTVEQPNGEIRRTKRILGIRFYPKVPKGSIVSVATKQPDPAGPAGEQKAPPDWNQILSDTLAKVTSIVTLLVLIDKI